MEFMDDPLLLEAALVRCTQNRSETRYAAECINVREAVKLIEAKEEANQRAALEAQSQRKRDALRRTQRAAAKARRRVREAEQRRQEEEYLAQFGQLPPDVEGGGEAAVGNEPIAVIPKSDDDQESASDTYVEPLPSEGSNAPTVDTTPAPETDTDLESIRDELRRRNDDDGSN